MVVCQESCVFSYSKVINGQLNSQVVACSTEECLLNGIGGKTSSKQVHKFCTFGSYFKVYHVHGTVSSL